MRHHIEHVVNDFLRGKYDAKKGPILLALSGGYDSRALFHVLLALKNVFGLKIHCAHVDHRWREESTAEAKYLQEYVQGHGLPFHLKTLDVESCEGNMEEECRYERINFFCATASQHSCQAVVTAHHGDDQAETVLKRIFEGATLPKLGGMEKVTLWEGIEMWRPFLSVTKKEILSWLKKKNIEAFDDETNYDSAFLRGRMRSSLIPHLSKLFGKEITSTLGSIGEEASQLALYLEEKLTIPSAVKGPWGALYCCNEVRTLHPYERKYVIREILRREEILPTRYSVEKIDVFLEQGASYKHVEVGGKDVFIERGNIFVVERMCTLPCEKISLAGESACYGPWRVEICEKKGRSSSWRDVWEQGEGSVMVPPGRYTLISPVGQKRCAKRWTAHKVPVFLRRWFPVVVSDEGEVYSFFDEGRDEVERSHCVTIQQI
jgi:tRNA(Ile)-lysidine synthase